MKMLKVKHLFFTILLLILSVDLSGASNSLWMHISRYGREAGKPTELYLHFGGFPFLGEEPSKGSVWVKAPDGGVKELNMTRKGGEHLHGVIGGKYGGQYSALGFYEYVYKTSSLVRHYTNIRFFSFGTEIKEENKKNENFQIDVPLKIIPVTKLNMHQRLREGDEFTFKVLYLGKPLLNSPISVATQEGWKKQFYTDKLGKVKFNFIKDRFNLSENKRKAEKYLIEVRVKEKNSGKYHGKSYENIIHVTSRLLNVYPTPWEWQSKSMGYLTVLAAIMFVGGITAIRRRKR